MDSPLPTSVLSHDSTETPNRVFHPLFSQPDADVVLRSKDGVFFRVSSTTLRTTSGFFRSTLSLPQPGRRDGDPEEILHVEEDSTLFACLLSIVSGLGPPLSSLSNFESVSRVLYTAEKYEMPGVISSVQLGITAPRFLAQPLQLYALARRYNWDEEVELATTLSHSLDISLPKYNDVLSTINSVDLMQLLRLRWARRDALRTALNKEMDFQGSRDPYECPQCGNVVDLLGWREWKLMIIDEISRIPSGETILSDRFLSSPQADRVFGPRCPAKQCSKLRFNREMTIDKIRQCVESLPTKT